MEAVAFGRWLAMIGQLDAVQHSLALRELALADPAGDAVERRDALPSPGETTLVAPAVAGPVSDVAPGLDILSQVGQGRIASFGCPHCARHKITAWGKASGKPRYRCAGCRKTFNPLTGTPLAGLHFPERWSDQAQALMSGESATKAAERCAVNYTTAFRWRHRFLAALKPAIIPGVCRGLSRRMRRSFWNPSKASAAASPETRVSAAARPPSGASRPNKSRSLPPVTAPAPPLTQSCRGSTLQA